MLLRQGKATRRVPIVFAGGAAEKVARLRRLLPDATYARWPHVRAALRRSLTRAPREPTVPGTMAGYSGTPLAKKLGIRAGSAVRLLGAPAAFARMLAPLPEGVRLVRRAEAGARVILLFARTRSELQRRFPAAARALRRPGALWIAWRKQVSGARTDLTQDAVRRFGLGAGLVDYKICAIDETWSGLCFSRRA